MMMRVRNGALCLATLAAAGCEPTPELVDLDLAQTVRSRSDVFLVTQHGDDAATTCADEDGSLRWAIACANERLGLDEIVVGPGSILLDGAELVLTDDLVIRGPGRDALSISGDQASRVFRIDAAAVSLEGLTVSDGFVVIDADGDGASDFPIAEAHEKDNGIWSAFGGGIAVTHGTLTLHDVAILDNAARGFTDDDEIGSALGGGVGLMDSTLVANHTIWSGNSAIGNARGFGGAIQGWRNTITLEDSEFSDNTVYGVCAGGGGALAAANSTLRATGVSMLDNRAEAGKAHVSCAFRWGPIGLGGAIFALDDDIDLDHTVIAGNSTRTESFYNISKRGFDVSTGGGIYFNHGACGATSQAPALTARDSQIVDNHVHSAALIAVGIGGGLLAEPGTQIHLKNTLVSGNATSAGSPWGYAFALGGGISAAQATTRECPREGGVSTPRYLPATRVVADCELVTGNSPDDFYGEPPICRVED